jgi:hypothetical protein
VVLTVRPLASIPADEPPASPAATTNKKSNINGMANAKAPIWIAVRAFMCVPLLRIASCPHIAIFLNLVKPVAQAIAQTWWQFCKAKD